MSTGQEQGHTERDEDTGTRELRYRGKGMWATAREKDVWEMAHRKGIGATHIGIGARVHGCGRVVQR